MSQSLLKQTVKNSLFSTLSTGATFVIALLFAGFRIRLLGVERAGFMMLLESVIAMTVTLGGFGFGTAALRKIAVFHGQKKFKDMRTTLSSVLFMSAVIGLIIAIAMPAGFNWIFKWSRTSEIFRVDAFNTTILLGMSFFVRQIFTTYEVTFSSLQRYDIIAMVNSFFGFLAGGLGLLTLLLFPTMTALALLSLSLALIHAIVSISIVYHLIGGAVFPRWNFTELRSMAGFGGWAYLGSLSNLLMNGLDKVILTTFLGSASLPYYVIGQRVVQQVHAFLNGQSQFLFPMLASYGDKAGATVRRVEDRLRWFTSFSAAVIYGGLAVLAYPLLLKLVGEDFAKIALIPFMLACLQGFFVAMSIVPFYISWAEGRGAPNAINGLMTGIVIAGTTVLLVPRLGVAGASIAQLWYLVSSLLLIYSVSKLGGRFSVWRMFRPMISPLSVLLLWFFVDAVAGDIREVSWFLFFIVIFIAGLSSVLIGVFLEKYFFKDYRCIETLKSVGKIVIGRLTFIRSV